MSDNKYKGKTFEQILKAKMKYYNETTAAYQFAGEEIERQLNSQLAEKDKTIEVLEKENREMKIAGVKFKKMAYKMGQLVGSAKALGENAIEVDNDIKSLKEAK